MEVDFSTLSRVIAIASGKGGVGKSSLAANLAGLAAAAGYRVLLLEPDPQADQGLEFGYFDTDLDDQGEGFVRAVLAGEPLPVNAPGIRERLDLIASGPEVEKLDDPDVDERALAYSLSLIAGNYDLIVIDTPPSSARLQTQALFAARWLIAPTKTDAASLRALGAIARRLTTVRSEEHPIDLLAVVLTMVGSRATRVRANAEAQLLEILGEQYAGALSPHIIRDSAATAQECRNRGILVHELAEKVDGAESYWKALAAGRTPERLPGSAPALADDYVNLTHWLLSRISEHESAETGGAS